MDYSSISLLILTHLIKSDESSGIMLRLHRNLYRIKRSIREKNPEKNFGNFSEVRKESRDEKVEHEKIEIIEIDSADIEIYKPKEQEIEQSKSWNNEKNLESYHKARDFLELQRAIDEATAIQESSTPHHSSVDGLKGSTDQRYRSFRIGPSFSKIVNIFGKSRTGQRARKF